MHVKIIADSTCDLPKDIIEKYDIDIVPLYVVLGAESFKDGTEIDIETLIDWSNDTRQSPKTSAPSVDDFINAFNPYIENKRDVIFISISSELSATYQNAVFAINSLDGGNIIAIDSKNVSVGTGMSVIKAAELAQKGVKAKDIKREILEYLPKVKASFIFDNLEFLKRGGRCSAAKALAASALKIKPRIDAVDGKLIPIEKYRGSLEKTVIKFCKSICDNLDEMDSETCFIGSSTDDGLLVNQMHNYFKEKNYFKRILKTDAGCIITSHSGPNAYAVVMVRK